MLFFKKNKKKIYLDESYISSVLSEVYKFCYKNNFYQYRSEIIDKTLSIQSKINELFQHNISSHYNEITFDDVSQLFLSSFHDNSFLLNAYQSLFLFEEKKSNSNQDIFWKIKFSTKNNQEYIFYKNKKYVNYEIIVYQNDWIDFFEKLAIDYFDKTNYFFFFDVLKKELLKIKQHFSKTEEEWYEFFYDKIFEYQKSDPRILYFLRALQIRKNICDLLGISWLEGTGFNNIGSFNKISHNSLIVNKDNSIEINNKNNSFYLNNSELFKPIFLAMTHDYLLKFLTDNEKALLLQEKISLEKLIQKTSIDFSNEFKITWLSHHLFIKDNALSKLSSFNWNHILLKEHNVLTSKPCYELVQFLFLKTAIRLSLLFYLNEDKNSLENSRNSNNSNVNALYNQFLLEVKKYYTLEEFIILFYQQLSQLKIILPSEVYRELNKLEINRNNQVNFLKNFSCFIEDNYENIQQVIYEAIVSTKWSGTTYLDFSNIRIYGEEIRDGLRFSKGVYPYIEGLNNQIQSQGREYNDYPINVSLPIHHIELSHFFKKEKTIIIEDNVDTNISSLAQQQEEDLIERENKQKYIKNDFLKRSVIIPDFFLWRLYKQNEQSYWYLLNLNYLKQHYPNLNPFLEKDYTKIEELINQKIIPKKQNNVDIYKKYNINYFFNNLLLYSKKNNICFIFKDNSSYFLDKLFNHNSSNTLLLYNNEISPIFDFLKSSDNSNSSKRYYLNFAFNLSYFYKKEESSVLKNNAFFDKESLKESLNFYFILVSLFFTKYNIQLFGNLIGLDDLIYYLKGNDINLNIEQERNHILLNFFNIIKEIKKDRETIFNLFTIKKDKSLLSYNSFVNNLNERRQEAKYFSSIKGNDFIFDNFILDYHFGMQNNKSFYYFANTKENYLGSKHYLLEIFDFGKKRIIHSPHFVHHYHQNIVEHEVFSKTFLKNSQSFFKKHINLFKDFYYSEEYYYRELSFYKNYIPFFKTGCNANLNYIDIYNKNTEELKIILLNNWLNGITSVSFF